MRSATRTSPPTSPPLSVSRRVTTLPLASAGLSARLYVLHFWTRFQSWTWGLETDTPTGSLQRPSRPSPNRQGREEVQQVLNGRGFHWAFQAWVGFRA